MKNLYVFAAVSAITLTGSVTAYLSPQEVFTDLEIPEIEEEVQPDTMPVEEEVMVNEQENQVQAMPMQEDAVVNEPAPEEAVPESLPEQPSMMEAQQEPIEETSDTPTFFRSGRELEQKESLFEPEENVDVFNMEEESIEEEQPLAEEDINEEPIEEVLEEEPQVEEEIVPEPEEAEEEIVQPAAPRKSLFMRVLSASRYYVTGFAILVAGLAYFFLGKKKNVPAGMNPVAEQGGVAQQTSTQPEESSPRLEKALKAMEQEGIEAAGQRLKEVQDQQPPDSAPPSVASEQ